MDLNNRLTVEKLNDRGCINMLCVMVKHMRRDFVDSYCSYLVNPSSPKLERQYNDIKEEFQSDYFKDLTGMDGKWIVKKLEAGVRNGIGQYA